MGPSVLKVVPPITLLPFQALEAASLLSEYTLTDRGTWLPSPRSVTSQLKIFKTGTDDANDPLPNPAHVLLGSNANANDKDIVNALIKWVLSEPGGQYVVSSLTYIHFHNELISWYAQGFSLTRTASDGTGIF
jgi:ABC-type tungstate transport system permease subunit